MPMVQEYLILDDIFFFFLLICSYQRRKRDDLNYCFMRRDLQPIEVLIWEHFRRRIPMIRDCTMMYSIFYFNGVHISNDISIIIINVILLLLLYDIGYRLIGLSQVMSFSSALSLSLSLSLSHLPKWAGKVNLIFSIALV
jgi:hypothetical protein